MLKNYLTVAWRTLLRNKLYFFINVSGLAIGISACLVIFLIVNFEMSFDTFHPGGDRIYRVYSEFHGDWNGFNRGVPSGLPPTAYSELTGVESMTGFHTWNSDVFIDDPTSGRKEFPSQEQTMFAGPEYFNVFSAYQWVSGSPSTSLTKPFQVVLTESKAKTYFGITDPSLAIGREIHYKDSLVVSVSGIVKDIDKHTDFYFTDFISLSTINASWMKSRVRLEDWESTNSSSQFFIKLLPGTHPVVAEARIAALFAKHRKVDKDNHTTSSYHLQPLSNLHFSSDLHIFDSGRSSADISTLKTLVVVAFLLLIIASINFINLETAQSVKRAREVGIRKVIGSRRSELILHFLMQSFLLTTFASVLALPIAEFAIVYFKDFIPAGLKLHIADPFVIIFMVASIVVVSLLAGLYPAFSLSSMLPAHTLKNQMGNSVQTRTGFIRKALIVFQFTFAQAMIVGTLIVGWQISYMLNKDLGFAQEAVMYVDTPWWEESRKVSLLKTELERIPEIQALSLCANPPASNSWSSSTFEYNNGTEELHHNVFRKNGDTAFLNVFGIKLIAGRNLHRSDTVVEYLINETYAKALGFQDPNDALDKMIKVSDHRYPIVGVVRDFNMQSLRSKIEPVAIANEESNFGTFGIRLTKADKGEDIKKAIGKMEDAWKKIYPNQKMEYAFMDESVAKFYESEQRTAKLVNTATFIAVLISCLGLFGLASFTAMQRTKEIGVRKVLGATATNIVTLLSREFLWLVLIAFVIAAPAAYYLSNNWLSEFAFKTSIGWSVFAWTVLASIVIVLLSVSYQAIKAALTDPVKSLRYE